MPSFRNKPAWLYDAMPAIYLFGGAAAIVLERGPIGLASGALLIVCSITVTVTRWHHRRRENDPKRGFPASRQSRYASVISPPSRLASTTELVRAMLPPKLGHADLDRQHRSLASRTATLRVSFAHNDDAADLELQIHDLVDSLAHHVATEITALARLGVARPEEAVQADRARLKAIERDVESHRVGGLTTEALVERVAGVLVAGHLASAHPPLPSMEMALHLLRDADS